MQNETRKALENIISKIDNIDEYNVEEVNDEQIVGPMKWIILIFGPNHHARDLKQF